MSRPTEFSYDEVKSLFEKSGCTLLSKSYGGFRDRLKYIAKCGHESTISFSVFKNGRGIYCKKCSPKRKAEKKETSIEKLRKEYEANGCKLLSDKYEGCNAKLRYVCQCGHEHSMPYYCFHRGQGRKCPSCVGNKKKNIDDVRKIFSDNGCKLLTKEYKWNRQKVEYIAQCGHKHTIKASAFFEGEGRKCPKCAREEVESRKRKYSKEQQKQILESHGCRLITPAITTSDKMVYYAQCGHIHRMTVEYFLEGHGWLCKNCYTKTASVGEKIVKEVLDEFGIKYKSQLCIRTGKRNFQRIDFYLPDFGVAIEYNGKQHYNENNFFHRHNNSFESQNERDLRKLRYCQEHGIRVIYIDGRRWSQKRMVNGDLKSFVKGLFVNEGFVENQMEFNFK